MAKPLVLAFDTSGPYCAAALLSGDQLLADRKEDMTKGQVERLMPLLEDLLDEARASWSDLAAIGVGVGPGNFTGIRISVAAARGLALSLGIPAIGVNVLQAQAVGIAGRVISTWDARQDKLYAQVFDDLEPVGPPVLCQYDTLPLVDQSKPPSTCVGYQSDAVARLYSCSQTDPVYPIAEAIGRIAHSQLDQENPRPAPLYIRAPDAAPPRDPAPVILGG